MRIQDTSKQIVKKITGAIAVLSMAASLLNPISVQAAEKDDFHGPGTYNIGNASGSYGGGLSASGYRATSPTYNPGGWARYDKCDDNVQAIVSDTGNGYRLDIVGEGAMGDYIDWIFLPWGDVHDQITSVYIADGITNIGASILDGAAISSVEIPDSVTRIGDGAFYNCDNLTSVVIPDSVEIIEPRAFASCDNLTSADLGNGVKYLGEEAFQYDHNLKNVKLSDNLELIERYAFYDCFALDSIEFPETLTTIHDSAFSSTDITSVYIPDSVKTIEAWTFSDCPIENVYGFRNATDLGVGLFKINQSDTGMTRLFSTEPMPISVEENALNTTLKDYDWAFDNREVRVNPETIAPVSETNDKPQVEEQTEEYTEELVDQGYENNTEEYTEPTETISNETEIAPAETIEGTTEGPASVKDNADNQKAERNKKVFRSVAGALAVGTIGVALAHTTGALHYLWLLVLALIYRRKRIKFHGMLADTPNRFIQVKDNAFDMCYTVQDIIDESASYSEFVTALYDRKEYTLVPYQTRMSIAYSDNNDIVTGDYDADEDTLYKEVARLVGAGEVEVHIYNIRYGFDIELKFDI